MQSNFFRIEIILQKCINACHSSLKKILPSFKRNKVRNLNTRTWWKNPPAYMNFSKEEMEYHKNINRKEKTLKLNFGKDHHDGFQITA